MYGGSSKQGVRINSERTRACLGVLRTVGDEWRSATIMYDIVYIREAAPADGEGTEARRVGIPNSADFTGPPYFQTRMFPPRWRMFPLSDRLHQGPAPLVAACAAANHTFNNNRGVQKKRRNWECPPSCTSPLRGPACWRACLRLCACLCSVRRVGFSGLRAVLAGDAPD